jgi:heparin binding hemagglutinin HbhA
MEETDMARTNSITQNRIDPTRPFFAAVGTVDYAVHVARTAQTRLRPKALVGTVGETVDDLNKQYVDLAARGRTLVNRIRRQEATQQATAEARKTTSKARTTTAQTKKTAGTAKSSAKATGTSARKTATATKKAAQGAAAKTGA